MGAGDELMALGEAYSLHVETGKRVAITDKAGRPRSHALWRGHKWLSDTLGPDVVAMKNGSGCRPYIESIGKDRYTFRKYMPHTAPLTFTKAESDFSRIMPAVPYVVVDPMTKERAPAGKAWQRDSWVRFALQASAAGFRLVQPVWPGAHPLPRVMRVPVATHRETAAVIKGAAAVVCHEGFNHHAAAAFSVPAVAIYGAFIAPSVTGYASTRPIYRPHTGDYGCGSRGVCLACRKAMDGITPEMVLATLSEALTQ